MNLGMLWPSRNGQLVIEDLGFLVHEPEEEYRARSNEYLDCEQLGDFREDAFLYNKRQRGLVPPRPRYEDEVDRATVVRILRGREHYEAQYAFGGPINPRTGEPFNRYSSEYEKWAAEQNRPVLTREQAELIDHIDFGFRTHEVAKRLLSQGVAHGVVRSRVCGVPCQARFDWLNPKQGIVAVVTCDRLTYVESHLRSNGPTHRLAFERAALEQAVGKKVPVHLIAVEKRQPHRCGVWVLSERLLRRAEKENAEAITRLMTCHRQNRWPTGYETVRTLAPFWI
jgi:hypothetical protein